MISYAIKGELIMAFNQQKYIDNYNKNNYKMFQFRVRKDDKKILNKLDSVLSLNKYIYTLISEDINSSVLTIKEIKEKILPVFKKHNINEVYLFGSYSRGEANSESDVDIYCSSGDIQSLIEQEFLEEELKNSLNKEVDLIFIGSRMDSFFKKQLDIDKIRLS